MNRSTKLLKSFFRNVTFVALRKARCIMELFEGLRKRKGGVNGTEDAKKGIGHRQSDEKNSETRRVGTSVEGGTYWLTRIVFLRSLGFIYCKLLRYSRGKLGVTQCNYFNLQFRLNSRDNTVIDHTEQVKVMRFIIFFFFIKFLSVSPDLLYMSSNQLITAQFVCCSFKISNQ